MKRSIFKRGVYVDIKSLCDVGAISVVKKTVDSANDQTSLDRGKHHETHPYYFILRKQRCMDKIDESKGELRYHLKRNFDS